MQRKQSIYHITRDMSEEEVIFLEQLTNLIIAFNNEKNLKLINIAAVIGYQRVIINEEIKNLIKQTEYYKKYGMAEVEKFFIKRIYNHIKEANDITYSKDVVMLTSISSKEITPDMRNSKLPGETYHQDGRGLPVSTKITLVTKRVWTGGTLHLLELPEEPTKKEEMKKAFTGKTISDKVGDKSLTLKRNEAVLFNNRETLHAVDPTFNTDTHSSRVIYQERVNNAETFNWSLLINFGITAPLTHQPSMLDLILSSYVHKQSKGQRFKEIEDLSHDERIYKEEHEAPNVDFQNKLFEKLGSKFEALTKQFDEDGVVIIPNFFDETTLEEMQAFFNKQISAKQMDPLLSQSSFNAAVDKDSSVNGTSTVGKAVTTWPVLALIGAYLGHPPVLANWRGYRLDPSEPLLYRAWDWHNDQKRKEVKIMVLLSDVDEDGQAMQVIKGSHKKWWNLTSQSDTKYNIDEAVSLGKEQNITKCFGPAGTIIFFDTNIVHRGARGPKRRDVMTFNFLPNKPGAALFPMEGTIVDPGLEGYRLTALTRQMPSNQQPDQLFLETMDGDDVRETFNQHKAITTEQDTSDYETQVLIEDYYETPRYEDRKPRLDTQEQSSKEFFEANALNDFNSDLDLTVRFGSGDVDRDIQFVVFRDRSPDSPESKRLVRHLASIHPDLSKMIDLEDFRKLAAKLVPLKEIRTGDKDEKGYKDKLTLMRCGKLAEDLEIAFSKGFDSLQRLRTTIIFLYATYDCVNTLQPSPQTQQALDTIAQAYVSIILLDDYANRQKLQKGYDLLSTRDVHVDKLSFDDNAPKNEEEPKESDSIGSEKAEILEGLERSVYERSSETLSRLFGSSLKGKDPTRLKTDASQTINTNDSKLTGGKKAGLN